MDHLEAVNTLASERYVLDEMAEDERQAFEAHYFDCAECAEDVRHAGLLRDGVRAGFAAGSPARGANIAALPRHASRPSLVRTVLPWAVAATFAILAGYQTVSLPRLQSQTGATAVVLAPVTLRPASRGAEPVVSPGPAGMVTLAVDLPAPASGSSLEYDIRDAAGRSVAHGRAQAPSGGAPLLLTAPSTVLEPAGHYILTVRDPANTLLTDAAYRFTVAAH